MVSSICRQITLSGWKPDYIVGITRGGLVPAVMISHYLDVRLETLNVSLRDSKGGLGPESNLWMAEDAFGYVTNTNSSQARSSAEFQKNILIVDDINDSGATINWIAEDWKSGCLPTNERWDQVWNNNVKFAVLFDNAASKCNFKMDFVGEEINKAEQDVWIDFPYESWWLR